MQFEFIQKIWVNSAEFPPPEGTTKHGHDAIIGQHHDTGFVNLKKQDGTFQEISG